LVKKGLKRVEIKGHWYKIRIFLREGKIEENDFLTSTLEMGQGAFSLPSV
jgi:hypothetical protein